MKYIALLRGINVGGHNKIKMAELRELLSSLGFQHVQTYLQSGNVVFETDISAKEALENRLSKSIDSKFGFEPKILLLTFDEITQAVESNPFNEASSTPKSLHFGFLKQPPDNPDIEKLNKLQKDSERFELTNKVFYLHTPDGVGRSKLAAGSEKALGVPMTDRNFRTVRKIIEMATVHE